jgi:hypothetical protein
VKNEIVNWVKKVCLRYNLEAIYVPDNDVYSIRKNGRGVHNFNTPQFYQLPKRHREELVHRLLRVGLVHNLGEKYKNQLYLNRRLGKIII